MFGAVSIHPETVLSVCRHSQTRMARAWCFGGSSEGEREGPQPEFNEFLFRPGMGQAGVTAILTAQASRRRISSVDRVLAA